MRSILFLIFILVPVFATAQVDAPDPNELFIRDSEREEARIKRRKKEILKTDKVKDEQLKLDAPQLEYLGDSGKVKLKNGLQISKGQLEIKAREGVVNLNTKTARVKDNVFLSSPEASIRASKATLNYEKETGEFHDVDLNIEASDFNVKPRKLRKLSEFDYQLLKTDVTPCKCADGSVPWSFKCHDLKIREEGYARARHFKFRVNQSSIFYLPYFIFPVKQERQSGLLFPQIGYSNRNGFQFKIPYFVNLGESTDLIVHPFIEAKTRRGAQVDFNKVFSSKSAIKSRFFFSDESPRDGNLRGTVAEGVFDPEVDDDRFAAAVTQYWKSDSDALIPVSWASDIHYASDDLALRKLNDPMLGVYNARFLTSTSVLSANIAHWLSADLSAEYNQSILTDDDLIFQRLPELNVNMDKSFRLLGNRIRLKNRVQATEFVRDLGYEGSRLDINPGVEIPFHYKNYISGDLQAELNSTTYNLNEASITAEQAAELYDDNRNVATFQANIGTELEKISQVSNDSFLSWLTSIGRSNYDQRLIRTKQTLEPRVSFLYVPDEDQEGLPLFDSLDRLRERKLLRYGFKSTLIGRFQPLSKTADRIPELTPEVSDLPQVAPIEKIPEFGINNPKDSVLPKPILDKGSIRELATFEVYQNYDFLHEDEEDTAADTSALSDLYLAFGIYPGDYFAFKFDSNIDVEDQDFSSWALSTSLKDDRGDSLRLRYSYLEDRISQLEGNLEVVFTEKLRLGYYLRYDERDNKFIDNQLALRISSSCNCWDLDLGFRERLNPDNKDFIASLTLKGLGAIDQNFSLLEDEDEQI